MTWRDVLDNWELFALDLQDIGIDVWDRDLMRSRPGVWIRSAVAGLLNRPPAGFYTEPAGKDSANNPLERRHPVWPNRVQRHFYEPRYATG